MSSEICFSTNCKMMKNNREYNAEFMSMGQTGGDILEGNQPVTTESFSTWDKCSKYPGHTQFITIPDFLENHLPTVLDAEGQELLKAVITLTVRLRVSPTSHERRNDKTFEAGTGTTKYKLGTGFVEYVKEPIGYRNSFGFLVRTAHHVVSNSEEAENTEIDFFYDNREDLSGRVKTLKGSKVYNFSPEGDWTNFWCNTADLALGNTIKLARMTTFYVKPERPILSELQKQNMPSFDSEPIMIVSHPHGEPKRITFGILKCNDQLFPQLMYNAPTCHGSSGARIIRYGTKNPELFRHYLYLSPVHSGRKIWKVDGEWLNYGNWYWWRDVRCKY